MHHTGAAAGAAGFDLAAGLGARASTHLAVFLGRNANLRVFAVGRFFERQFHGVAQVAAAKHLASAARAATLLAKHVAKNVTKSFGKAAKAFAATRATHIGVYPGVAVLVVGGALLRIRQHLVGLFGLFEFDLGLFGRFTLVAVGVELHCQLAVGLFNFLV